MKNKTYHTVRTAKP